MAKHTKDIINELLIMQNKIDTIFEECLNDSMTRPLLWVPFKDAFDMVQRGHALPQTRKAADNHKA